MSKKTETKTEPITGNFKLGVTQMDMKHRQYIKVIPQETNLDVNKSAEGETIEEKVYRIVNNKEPIKDGAPQLYTERKEGVLPGTNIRTDRFEQAIDGMDAVTKDRLAKRSEREAGKTIGEKAKEGMEKETKGQSGDGTNTA